MSREIVTGFEPLVEALERNWLGAGWNTFQHPGSALMHCVYGEVHYLSITCEEWREVADDPDREDALLRSKFTIIGETSATPT